MTAPVAKKQWVALLRAINVGKRRYPMAELRAALAAAGFEGASTHIQSGNVLVASSVVDRGEIERRLEEIFEADRGFAVPTICVSGDDLRQLVADSVELERRFEAPTMAVSVLKHEPSSEVAAAVEELSLPGERLVVRDRGIHVLLDGAFHESKLNWTKIERIAGPATNRNQRVLTALASKWA